LLSSYRKKNSECLVKKFVRIIEAATERKGGEAALAAVLSPVISTKKLAQMIDF
jgi:hypothetical protein